MRGREKEGHSDAAERFKMSRERVAGCESSHFYLSTEYLSECGTQLD